MAFKESYQDVLGLPPLAFLAYIEQYKTDVSCDPNDAESVARAGQNLGKITNTYAYLATLYSYAGALKRQLARDGKTEEHDDMIDREKALERMMKVVDMEYRSLSKVISMHMDARREMYYTDGITFQDPRTRGRK